MAQCHGCTKSPRIAAVCFFVFSVAANLMLHELKPFSCWMSVANIIIPWVNVVEFYSSYCSKGEFKPQQDAVRNQRNWSTFYFPKANLCLHLFVDTKIPKKIVFNPYFEKGMMAFVVQQGMVTCCSWPITQNCCGPFVLSKTTGNLICINWNSHDQHLVHPNDSQNLHYEGDTKLTLIDISIPRCSLRPTPYATFNQFGAATIPKPSNRQKQPLKTHVTDWWFQNVLDHLFRCSILKLGWCAILDNQYSIMCFILFFQPEIG